MDVLEQVVSDWAQKTFKLTASMYNKKLDLKTLTIRIDWDQVKFYKTVTAIHGEGCAEEVLEEIKKADFFYCHLYPTQTIKLKGRIHVVLTNPFKNALVHTINGDIVDIFEERKKSDYKEAIKKWNVHVVNETGMGKMISLRSTSAN